MNSADIYVKTSAGTHELKSRARQLPQRLRTMLIMIDGSRSVAQLRQAADRLGAPEDFLANLESQGLVQRVARIRPEPALPVQPPSPAPMPALSDGERFNTAKQFMNDTIVDNLGLRAFFFTLKLEKCFTLADLEAMLPDYSKAIAKSRGSDVARKLEAQARSKLR
jgi:hypothetical protein